MMVCVTMGMVLDMEELVFIVQIMLEEFPQRDGDCDDTRAERNPEAEEFCNEIDDDW